MSSTVSCSSAAHSVAVSRRMPAQILATPTGWVMKSSPGLAALVGVVLAGEQERVAGRPCGRSARRPRRRARRRSRTGRPSSSCSSVVRSSGIASVPSSPCSATVDRAMRGDRDRRARRRPSADGRRSAGAVQAAAGASDCCWSGIAVRPRAVAGRPRMRRSARARCAAGCSAARRAGPSRSSSASPSSARTRTSRPASAADLGCGPSPREQRLARLTARHPRRAQGAVDGGQRVAQGEVPFVYP